MDCVFGNKNGEDGKELRPIDSEAGEFGNRDGGISHDFVRLVAN